MRNFAAMLAGTVLVLACTQAIASRVVPTDFTCPITGRKFQALEQTSYYQRGMRLDTRPLGAVSSPPPLAVCPDRSQLPLFKREFSKEEISKLTQIVETAEYRKIRGSRNAYYAVSYLQEKLGYDEIQIAMSALKALWAAENGRRDVELYLEYALDRFNKAASVLAPSEKWAFAVFLAAELSRRLGRFNDASDRLGQLEAGMARNGLQFPAEAIVQQRDLIAREVRTPEERR
jgi:hypothetical protein